MTQLNNIQQYYAKLANNEAIPEDEIISLLKELASLRDGVAHLASCQASTLGALPRSASKSARGRHIEICKSAAKILQGDVTAFRYRTTVECALKDCLEAVAEASGAPARHIA